MFLATEYFTEALPVWLVFERLIQETLLCAVHWQVFDEAVRLTLPLPPVRVKDLEVGEMR